MKIRDRKRWERELTDHMRRHAADLHQSVRKLPRKAQVPRKAQAPGIWMTAPRLILWSLFVVILTSVGWVAGLYLL